jgi:hypothetical protein
VTYTATVAPTDGGGTVSFTQNGSGIGGCQSLALDGAGRATCTLTYEFRFPIAIQATYSGDGSFDGSSSTVLNQVVDGKVETFGSLSSSSQPVTGGQPVTFTATVTPIGAPAVDGGGTVSFTDNGTTIAGCGAVALTADGRATCTMVSPGPEFDSVIEADYSGDDAFAGGRLDQVLQDVEAQTSLSPIISSANPSAPGQQVTFTTTVSPLVAASNGTVLFSDNGSALPGCGILQPDPDTGQVGCTTTYANGGPHTIQAFYTRSNMVGQFAPSATPALSQVVGALTATTTTLSSATNPAQTGQAVTYTVTVSPTDGGGTVSFTDHGFPTAVGCISPIAIDASGHATCQFTFPDTASHSIVAIYSGDGSFAGSSSAAVEQTVSLATPAAPGAATAPVGTGAAQVSFTPPQAVARAASAASDVTGYNVYLGTSRGHESTTPVNASRIWATADGFTVTGLTNGTAYYFKVRAINGGGVGKPSAEVSVTPATPPTAPRNVAAHAAAESVKLTWAAPASNGGSRITGYNVYLGTTAGSESATPVNPSPLAAGATSYKVANLTDGTRYVFVVRAISAVAAGARSPEVSATPAAPPPAPAAVSASPVTTSVRLTWSAPGGDGGSPITGYNVYQGTSSGQESTTPVNPSPLPASATAYTVSGLTAGTTYYFRLTAVSAAGTGANSRQVSATPAQTTPPGSPTGLISQPGANAAALTWSAPGASGGKPITGYNVYLGTVSGLESPVPVNASPLAASARSYTVLGLDDATGYVFVVRALNALGAGAPSNEAAARPVAGGTVPAAPTRATATEAGGAGNVNLH